MAVFVSRMIGKIFGDRSMCFAGMSLQPPKAIAQTINPMQMPVVSSASFK